MNSDAILSLLSKYKDGSIDEREVLSALKSMPFESLDFAQIDHHRTLRQGYPEVIFCQGKTPQQVAQIAARINSVSGVGFIATRADSAQFEAVHELVPDSWYYETARIISLKSIPPATSKKPVCIATAGTADIPVAEEAAVTAEILGNETVRVYDVGVAGIHRLFAQMDTLANAGVIIVCAGMEGALASVIGGLTDKPVIAVPTSIGYGASFGGLTALLSMLNSCAAGIGVVNIDNGFGAGWLASKINQIY